MRARILGQVTIDISNFEHNRFKIPYIWLNRYAWSHYSGTLTWKIKWQTDCKRRHAFQFSIVHHITCLASDLFTYRPIYRLCTGAYISESSAHYHLPDWAHFGQKPGQNSVKQWSRHKIKTISELTKSYTPIKTPCLASSMNFNFLDFLIFWSYLSNWGTTRDWSPVVSANIRPKVIGHT